ncbi:S1 family peptidase [Pseudomonas sp. S36]|uniref:S1 family peptidase n=1 Tax=Pseudomonas sp. S36 TaxID=2767447 RepID=UPI0019132442|nr:serine protease [Pseudomonas sp. S36]MBK4989817.1 trypsin-like peptidase domain-containing protein [Pseudomonas sp. S36]
MDHFTQRVVLVGRISPGAVTLLGTGFFVGVEGLLVTSRHVVGNDAHGIVIIAPNINSFNQYQDVSDKSCIPVSAEVVDINPFADVVLLKVDAEVQGVSGLGSLDEVSVGEVLEIVGFPHCVDGRRVLTHQSAAVGAKVLLDSSSVKIKHAVINSQTRPGQSGSMVFSRRLNKIVGLLSGTYTPQGGGTVMLMGINPAELNQTSHIVSAEYIREMI